MDLDLVCDVLDKRVIDRNGRAMGRIDGIALEQRPGKPPRVSALLVGPSALGHRLSPALGRWVETIERVLGIAAGRPARIAFKQVLRTEPDVKVDLEVGDTSVAVVEDKLRGWIVALSGSK
jgi:sporulation protein YlmC with PRC-barrel domain